MVSLRTRIAELERWIRPAESDIHDSDNIENVRHAVAVSVGRFVWTQRIGVRDRSSAPECNVDSLDDIENIRHAITLRICVAITGTGNRQRGTFAEELEDVLLILWTALADLTYPEPSG